MSALWVQPDELGDYANTEYAQEACEVASYLMWAMSGRKYTGVTTVTERYVCKARDYYFGGSSKNTQAVLAGDNVYNIPAGTTDDLLELTADGLSPESRLRLRGRPVSRILAIRSGVTNELLSESSYYLVDHSTIQIQVGAAWTPCNVEVTYTYGTVPPTAGRMAARTLAIEFAKLWSDDETCALPQRVTSISRQGVSYTLLDSQDFIQEIRTGVYAVDLFLKTANPDGARVKSRVFSVDTPRARRYTPKPLALTASANDIVVPVRGTGSATATTASFSGTFLASETGWSLSVDVHNYASTRTGAQATATLNGAKTAVTVTVPYSSDLAKTLGMVDPGTYSVYATKGTTVTHLFDGNLTINLAG